MNISNKKEIQLQTTRHIFIRSKHVTVTISYSLERKKTLAAALEIVMTHANYFSAYVCMYVCMYVQLLKCIGKGMGMGGR